MPLVEQLIPTDLPTFVANLGIAIIDAGAHIASRVPTPLNAPSTPPGTPPPLAQVLYQMPEAEIEVKVSLSRDTTSTTSANFSGGIQAISVGASYSRTFSFKEEGSSTIRIKLVAVPAK